MANNSSKYPEYLQVVPSKNNGGAGNNLIKPKTNQSNITVIASGKGGVGKTWLSVNMSQVLAEYGQKVLLFDGDLGLANVDIQLGLLPDYDLGQVLSGKATLRQAITRYALGSFDIIAGQSGSGSLSDVQAKRLIILKKNLEYLATLYDRVFMDLGAGVDNTIRSLCAFAKHCMVVITDEPTSLTDAYAFIKMIKVTSPEVKIDVIVNQAESYRTGEKTFGTLRKVCQNFLQFTPDLLGIIRKDHLVKDSIRNQVTTVTRHPNAESVADMKNIASLLVSNR